MFATPLPGQPPDAQASRITRLVPVQGGDTPLHLAAATRSPESVKVLIYAKASVHASNAVRAMTRAGQACRSPLFTVGRLPRRWCSPAPVPIISRADRRSSA